MRQKYSLTSVNSVFFPVNYALALQAQPLLI